MSPEIIFDASTVLVAEIVTPVGNTVNVPFLGVTAAIKSIVSSLQ